MKTEPIAPARIDWDGGAPRAPDFGDLYHPRIGAFAQAAHVFLRGNGLPERWHGRERFTIVETGFGLGLNFLATWAAWRDDPRRCARLHYVAIDKHPPVLADLQRAHAALVPPELAAAAAELQAQWPPLTPNLHLLTFAHASLRLLLAFGDVARVLPALQLHADAFYLDGFAPQRNPAMWSPALFEALRRRAAPGARAATWSVARSVRDGLARAGFAVERAEGIGGKCEISVARHLARPGLRTPPDLRVSGEERCALVVGGGIAGACTAAALHAAGWDVTLYERRAAEAGSDAVGGIFHGSLHADDGPHARLLRTAALHAARVHGEAIAQGAAAGQAGGLLRLERHAGDIESLQALAARCGLPPQYVQPLAPAEAAARAGVPLAAPAWFYPGGGWVAPDGVVRSALRPVRVHRGIDVARLERHGTRWRLVERSGRVVGEAPLVVLCAAEGSLPLLATLGQAAWPTRRTRGQVSVLAQRTPLALPLAGDGYALPLADGTLLCGATRQPDDDDARVRAEDHRFNAGRARRLTGLDLPLAADAWQGHVGWRLQTPDRMPIAGALVEPTARAGALHQLARVPGLFVAAALGARGLTLAPLLGQLVAAMADGAPWPLERDLAAAVDPGRWLARAAGAAAASGAPGAAGAAIAPGETGSGG
ncbi:MAG: FAD-dependent 5-carboxymethylaminomethyl-2-thiouridine(34) oxidoreductase MnmC [Rubrivivax sp.]|nr:FAD-dependent 5-carboxymethylaminomethyl-2-thiouridine(34) oxidoreductase MnmC [Rubrivivax sp.]